VAHIEMAIEDSSKVRVADAHFESESFAHGKDTVRMTTHVRSVGFISKPGQIQELKTCLAGPLMDLLHEVPGFASAMVLHAQKESRNLLVLTFWESESQAGNNRWEEFPAVRKLLSPLIDVCTRVQTFQATLSQSRERCRQGKTAGVC
jgi:hypothetical protein